MANDPSQEFARAPRRRAPRGAGAQLRDTIINAATELLIETGYAKTVSIRSVAERAGVTSPSIYLHFADKDALLDAVCAEYFQKLDGQMQAAAAGVQHHSGGAVRPRYGLCPLRFENTSAVQDRDNGGAAFAQ